MAEERGRSLQEHERLFLGLERELLGVIGVVEAERDHGAGLERRQPDDVGFADDAPVGEADRLGACRRRLVDRACVGDARAPHAQVVRSLAKTRVSSLPRPSISTAIRAPARTRGAPGVLPASSTSPGASVMKSLTSAIRRATPRT